MDRSGQTPQTTYEETTFLSLAAPGRCKHHAVYGAGINTSKLREEIVHYVPRGIGVIEGNGISRSTPSRCDWFWNYLIHYLLRSTLL